MLFTILHHLIGFCGGSYTNSSNTDTMLMSLSGVLLLLLSHLSTLNCVDEQNINNDSLARVIAFFEQNYKRVDRNENELQYAVAINVPMVQCQAGFYPSQNTFLTTENAEDVKNRYSAQNPVYQGTDLIAAGVQRMDGYSIHSEYLLFYPTEERSTSPMQKLLMRRSDSCTILYTLNSPCTGICLNEGKYDIFPGLQNWKAHNSIKALVFKHIWREDINCKCLKKALLNIMKYVPLYRCKTDNECYNCEASDGEIDFRCYINY